MLIRSLLGQIGSLELPRVMPSRCARRFVRSTCDRCQKHCPVDAIELGRQPLLREHSCLGCAVCAAVCPTGAFEFPEGVWERLERALQAGSSQLSCSLGPHRSGAAAVPCLGALDLPLVLTTMRRLGGVRLSIDGCGSCKLAKNLNMERLAHLADQANAINQALGMGRETRLDLAASEKPTTPTAYSRRELFMALRGQSRSGPTVAADADNRTAIQPEKPQPREFSPPPRQRGNLWSEEIGILLSDRCEATEPVLPIPQPTATSKRCTFCTICVNVCPTGALEARESVEPQGLALDPARCIGCMLCVEVCPEGALAARETTTAAHLAKSRMHLLYQRAQFSCPRCGCETAIQSLCQDCAREKEAVDFFSNPRPTLRTHP